MNHFSVEVEQPGRALAPKGEGILAVRHTVKCETQEPGVTEAGDNIAKGILEVTFPEPAARRSADEVNQGSEALILQGHKGQLDASIDRRELQTWSTGMGKVVDGAEAGGVGLGYSTNGRANEECQVGDLCEPTFSEASGDLLADMGQPGSVHGKVAGTPANLAQWALVANAHPMRDATQQLASHLVVRVACQEAPPCLDTLCHRASTEIINMRFCAAAEMSSVHRKRDWSRPRGSGQSH